MRDVGLEGQILASISRALSTYQDSIREPEDFECPICKDEHSALGEEADIHPEPCQHWKDFVDDQVNISDLEDEIQFAFDEVERLLDAEESADVNSAAELLYVVTVILVEKCHAALGHGDVEGIAHTTQELWMDIMCQISLDEDCRKMWIERFRSMSTKEAPTFDLLVANLLHTLGGLES